jgi:hypothetical protein
MSTTPKDGGPAFPVPGYQTSDGGVILHHEGSPGMTLRDYFAVAATEADIEERLPRTCGEASELFKADGIKRTRVWARYRHADLMIAERTKANGGAL